MTKGLAGLLLMATAGCANVPPAEAEEVPVRGTGRACDAAKAQALVGRTISRRLRAEALRLSGAGLLRVIRPGMAVTMDYREDRLNLHLDKSGKVTKVACG